MKYWSIAQIKYRLKTYNCQKRKTSMKQVILHISLPPCNTDKHRQVDENNRRLRLHNHLLFCLFLQNWSWKLDTGTSRSSAAAARRSRFPSCRLWRKLSNRPSTQMSAWEKGWLFASTCLRLVFRWDNTPPSTWLYKPETNSVWWRAFISGNTAGEHKYNPAAFTIWY